MVDILLTEVHYVDDVRVRLSWKHCKYRMLLVNGAMLSG